jgi:hypothetical protein
VAIALFQGAGFACINAVTTEQAFAGLEIDNRETAAPLMYDVSRAFIDTVTATFTKFCEGFFRQSPGRPYWIMSS